MEDAKQQSILQGAIVAAVILGTIFAGITYLDAGAVDWETVWIVVFMAMIPWFGYLYFNQ